jgi:hypothetical protein
VSAESWLHHVEAVNPAARALYLSTTRAQFLDAAEAMIGNVVDVMETSRSTYRKLAEPDLSRLAKDLLGKLIPCDAESDNNGHVDLLIRHPFEPSFRHITEFKIWGGGSIHRGAMRQVLGYATGQEERLMCLSFFIHHKRMVFLLDRLRKELAAAADPAALWPDGSHPFLKLAFVTRHAHASGQPIEIVHLGCYLWEEGSQDLSDAPEA